MIRLVNDDGKLMYCKTGECNGKGVCKDCPHVYVAFRMLAGYEKYIAEAEKEMLNYDMKAELDEEKFETDNKAWNDGYYSCIQNLLNISNTIGLPDAEEKI